MTKGRQGTDDVEENLRFGFEVLGKSGNMKPTPELQVP
jgi:hypothetical protein